MLVLYLQIVLLPDRLKSLETFVKIIEKCIFIRYKTILSRNRIIKIIKSFLISLGYDGENFIYRLDQSFLHLS